MDYGDLLNWDFEEATKEVVSQQETDAMGSASKSESQTQLGGDDGCEGLKHPALSTQARKDGFSRLPSFPMAIGGVPSESGQSIGLNSNPGATGTEETETNDAQAAPTEDANQNLTNPFAMPMLYPLTGASQSSGATTGAVDGSANLQQQQQNLMVQYALTGQAAGAPFPSVTFNNDKRQLDTVSSLSTTSGRPAAKPAAATVSVAAAPTAHPSTHLHRHHHVQQHQATAGALPTTQLHPLGIQSSAGCPPLATTTAPASAATATNALQFNPYMYNPYTMLAGNPQLLAAYQSSQQQQLAAHFAAAQASAAQMTAAQANAAQLAAAQAAVAQAARAQASLPPPQKPKARPKKKAKTAKAKKTSESKEDTPPFLLFDAPCELRQNFMQSQRMHNLPVHHDSNSYHYGMSVNGFHPQLNVATDPITPLSRAAREPLPPGVKLLDSRHKKRGAGKERNEREQRRAQKITELIEQIRLSMEDGGWKVEMKSKYHTLSMCADYVKHLMKSTEEKEEAVEKAKSDLEVKERKLEEDKALLEGRSDPESVTSSLTAETAGSGKANANDAASDNAKPVSDTSSRSKRKAQEMEDDSSPSGSDVDPKKVKIDETKVDEAIADASGGDHGGSDSGSGSGSGNGSGPQGHNISIGKMSSSVSELTDSNRGSSAESGGEKTRNHESVAHKKHPREDEDESSDLPSSSSISSTAAVLRGEGSHHREHGHADVVFKEKKHSRHRKRVRDERSSLDRKFVIDYEEVFLTSNVPQIIATPAGRIVAWNKFFLKATGLRQDSVQRLTIFSLVQPEKLANLFEMVAEALRQNPTTVSESSSANSSSSSNQTTSESTPSSSNDDVAAAPTPAAKAKPPATELYAAMTLPCTSFVKAPAGEADKEDPLYMTVTLMPDENVGKRCFHCVFTDCKGTDGKMGFITPSLLAKLFADPKTASEKVRPQSPPAAAAKEEDVEKKAEEEAKPMEVDAVANGKGDND